MTVIDRAKALAQKRHAGMCRPNRARQPVIEHLAEVAALAEAAGCAPEAIAAAWLHDSVEDTETTLEEIRALCGDQVAVIVDGLTDPPGFSALPLAERKQRQVERLRQKPDAVRIVKLCDQISNVRSVLSDPPSDWTPEKCQTYIAGAQKIADVCAELSDYLDRLFSEIREATQCNVHFNDH